MDSPLFYLVCGAAAVSAQVSELIVIGSTAVIPWLEERGVPNPAWPSAEIDVEAVGADDPDLVEAVGELSYFHERHGVYAQAASVDLQFYAGDDWRERAGHFEFPSEGRRIRLCVPSVADLVASKLSRGSPHDWVFALAQIKTFDLTLEEVLDRLRQAERSPRTPAEARAILRRSAQLLPHRL